MRRPGGYLICTSPDGVVEQETFTCAHDQRIVVVPHRADPTEIGGMCYQCMKLVCPRCVAAAVCSPFEKKLDAIERRHDTLRSYGLA